MKRIALAAVASASAIAVAQPQPMEHILVSVPLHKTEAETALPITVLTGEELQRQAATTIGETLGSKPGIANASFGPGVGRPVIRGQQGPRAITLQNGMLSADASSLSPDHGVAVESLLAQSIEVLRGPSTLLYGGGAIGGVVNVIDNRIPRAPIEDLQGGIEYRYDEASSMDSSVGYLEGGNERFAFHLSGTTRDTDDLEIPGRAIDESALETAEGIPGESEEEHEEGLENTKGYIANTDSDTDVVTLGGSYQMGDKGFIGLAVNHLETHYGIPPAGHGHHEHEEEEHEEEHDGEMGHDDEEEEDVFVSIDLEQTRYDGMLHLHEPMPHVEVLRAFVTYTDYQHDELEGSEVGTRFRRDTWESRVELVHTPLWGAHGVVGLQWREDEFSALGEEAYLPKTDSSEVGLFLIEDFHHGDWTYEVGLRGDWVTRDPQNGVADSEDFSSLGASASALWAISPAWQLGLSLSHSERAPATEELFSNIEATDPEELVPHAATGAIEVGDPNLDTETALNTDLTLQWSGDRSWVELAVFYNNFQDYIFLFNSGQEIDETPVYLYRQDDAEFYGIELESSFHLVDLWSGSLDLEVFGDLISGEFDDNGDVPRLPPARLGAGLNWSDDKLTAWIKGMAADDQDNPGDFETDSGSYQRWDAGMDYRWRFKDSQEVLVFLKWKNIGDEEIRLSTSFLRNYAPEAGRSVEAGIRYTF